MLRKLIIIVTMVVLIFFIGTMGYYIIEKDSLNMSLFEAFYLSVITITTIGFGEIPGPLSTEGRILTICISLSGMGILLYSMSLLTSFIVEGHLKNLLFKRKMQKMVAKMENHYIVCGSTIKTEYISQELRGTKHDFVVVGNDEAFLEQLSTKYPGTKYVVGDISDDDIMLECGIMRAKGILTAQKTDQANIFTIITARRLNPALRIVSLAHEEKSIEKLKYAGADAVISGNFIGSMRMVSEMIRPVAVDFLDEMLKDRKKNWRIEQAIIQQGSSLVGKSLREANLAEKGKILILAILDGQRNYNFIPPADTCFTVGDTVILLGPNTAVTHVKKLAGN